MMNYQPVNEWCCPCGKCPEYLNSCMPVIINGFICGAECDFFLWILLLLRGMYKYRKELLNMKLINYDYKDLILQNVRTVSKETPSTYTVCQYRILCNLIRQKHITKQFFDFILLQLYDLSDWKKLTYEQMYELIHILTFYNYTKERN